MHNNCTILHVDYKNPETMEPNSVTKLNRAGKCAECILCQYFGQGSTIADTELQMKWTFL